MLKRLLPLLILSMALMSGTLQAFAQSPDDVRQALREAAAEYGVSADTLIRVVSCETGGRFNADAVGDRGRSWGIAQLHEAGLRPLFYRQGFSDPFNVWEASAFLAWAWRNGLQAHWTCARRG